MTLHTEAIYDGGVFRPIGPMAIPPHQRVQLAVEFDPPAVAAPDSDIAARIAALRATIPFGIGDTMPTREERNAR